MYYEMGLALENRKSRCRSSCVSLLPMICNHLFLLECAADNEF